MAKVIQAGNMFFEDDIKIIDSELDAGLSLPQDLPIFSRDEPQIIYNGRVFSISENASKDSCFKVYTMVYGIKETDSPKKQEDDYFLRNKTEIDKLKANFLEKVINGISGIDSIKTRIPVLGQELGNRITKIYEALPKPQNLSPIGGLVAKLNDDSVLNTQVGCERVLLLDEKVYELFTISEYISIFQNSFEPEFYKKVQQASKASSPEDISKMITENKDKVHRKVLPKVRNNIWHSDRSAKFYLDNIYWIPQYKSSNKELKDYYAKMLEKKIKIEAAGGLK